MLFEQEGYQIIKAFYNVHNNLGPGFLEAVYQEGLEIEFKKLGIPYKREIKINIWYEDVKLQKYYKADFICYDQIIIEIKSLAYLAEAHFRQTINELKATKYPLAYLVSFGGPKVKFKRIINTPVRT
jgi:GxxExxY protein